MAIYIPEFKSLPQCPKCGMSIEGGFQTQHHNGARYMTDWPCSLMAMADSIAGEMEAALADHLCRVCSRCKFGWVEQVSSKDDVYGPPEDAGEEG